MPYQKKPKIKDKDFRATAGYAKKRRLKLPEAGRVEAMPLPPEGMSDRGKKVFLTIAEDMMNRGLLYGGDIDFIAICAEAVADYFHIKARIKREGLVKKGRVNALAKEMHACANLALKYAQALRLLPFGREKSPGDTQDDDADVFAEIIKLKTKTKK